MLGLGALGLQLRRERASEAEPGAGRLHAQRTRRLHSFPKTLGSVECSASRMGSPPRRVLIADDNEDAADAAAMLLRLAGHEALAVYDGEQAVETARSFRPEIVILDINMPKLNGYGAAAALRARRGASGLPVLIALTSLYLPQDAQRAREAGFDHHMAKPANPDALQALVESAIPPGRSQG